MMQDPVLEAYLKRAREALAKTTGVLDPETLRKIALDVGMTAKLSETADRRALGATEAGRAHLESGERTEAIAQLEEAILLGPTRLQGHLLLARAYGQIWEEGRAKPGSRPESDPVSDPVSRKARDKAIALAHRCLEISPGHPPAEELLKALGLQPEKDALSWRQAALIVLILVGLSGSMSLCVRYTLIPDAPADGAEASSSSSPSSSTEGVSAE